MPESTQAANGATSRSTTRTLAQVTKELDQIASNMTSLELQMQAQREKSEELIQEQIELQSELMSRFGLKVQLINARDEYPVGPAVSRRRPNIGQARQAAPSGTGGPTRREMKEWATQKGWTFNSRSPQAKGRTRPDQFEKRLPVDMEEALERDYNVAHGTPEGAS